MREIPVSPAGGRSCASSAWTNFRNSGTWSEVGYRPERDYFIRQIEQRAPYFPLLYAVRPGVTSLFATTYSYAENMDQMMVRLSCDIEYLENYSVKQDLQVMMKTVPVVLKGIGK